MQASNRSGDLFHYISEMTFHTTWTKKKSIGRRGPIEEQCWIAQNSSSASRIKKRKDHYLSISFTFSAMARPNAL